MAEEEPVPSTSKFCQLCLIKTSIYTCPRCLLRTCSLTCSKQHKSLTRCTGERNKAGYIPMNQYTEGKFLDDYSWLEEGRRQIETWGKQIDEQKLAPTTAAFNASGSRGGFRGRGRGRGLGRDGGWSRQADGKETKLELLQRELGERGIDMRTLPEGMEKRRLNQSSWDPKTKSIYLSVETVFHLPSEAVVPNSTTSNSHKASTTFAYLLPRCNLSSTLAELYNKHPRPPSGFPGHKQKNGTGAGNDPVQGTESLRSNLTELVFAFRAPPSARLAKLSRGAIPSLIYLTPCQPGSNLEDSLEGQSFVEYPTLEIWLKADWERALVEGRITVVDLEDLEQEDEQIGEARVMECEAQDGMGDFGTPSSLREIAPLGHHVAGLPKRPAPSAQGFEDTHDTGQREKRQRIHAPPPIRDRSWGTPVRPDFIMDSEIDTVEAPAALRLPRTEEKKAILPALGGGLVGYGSSDEEEDGDI